MTVLVNAFEAMRGAGTLRLSVSVSESRLVIEIADTGPGIASGDLEKLFELRFVSKKDRVSMGLGLPMAQRIVEGHGGELTVESEPGKGTAFSIFLPTRT